MSKSQKLQYFYFAFAVIALGMSSYLLCCTKEQRLSIEWDASSRQTATEGVYARVKDIGNGKFALVYSAGPAVWIRTSNDKCDSWSEPLKISEAAQYNYTNSELTLLKSGRLIYSWNARPQQDGINNYKIMAATSDDGGATWREQTIYEAGNRGEEGCWEPVVLQLSDGELQLYFANEFPYNDSDEQEISMMRSSDDGESWSSPEQIAFRSHSRDGMPVPIYISRRNEIIVAIEDNGFEGRFKPVTVRSRSNWHDGSVTAESPRRQSALADECKLGREIYAGAPYLIAMDRDNTLLSIQSTEGRNGTNEQFANMVVYAGDSHAENFSAPTRPFADLPPQASALWSSLCRIDDNTVLAVTSVSGTGNDGIWTIKGHIVR